eukprot:767686-Hanusia_phi.AAC.5
MATKQGQVRRKVGKHGSEEVTGREGELRKKRESSQGNELNERQGRRTRALQELRNDGGEIISNNQSGIVAERNSHDEFVTRASCKIHDIKEEATSGKRLLAAQIAGLDPGTALPNLDVLYFSGVLVCLVAAGLIQFQVKFCGSCSAEVTMVQTYGGEVGLEKFLRQGPEDKNWEKKQARSAMGEKILACKCVAQARLRGGVRAGEAYQGGGEGRSCRGQGGATKRTAGLDDEGSRKTGAVATAAAAAAAANHCRGPVLYPSPPPTLLVPASLICYFTGFPTGPGAEGGAEEAGGVIEVTRLASPAGEDEYWNLRLRACSVL